MSNIFECANNSNAWPFVEARKILKKLGNQNSQKGFVLFETGYGPSGLPHIGTFGEVARTSMVQNAFRLLSDLPTRLYAFSDDMDGLRKVPENVPKQDMLANYLGKPLTQVPDPFGTHESFGHHNNARLREFLDTFSFNYEFKSSTEAYKGGEFDETLILILQNYQQIIDVIKPTLGDDRRKTYSPFLPICPKTGTVLQVPIIDWDESAATVIYQDGDKKTEVPVTGGHCKLQWKADWAMRWKALDVDYEMSGKDLIDSVKLSSSIVKILGGTPPAGFTYELFLDENGEKISKSRGNGLTIEDWLRYAPKESLSQFMYRKPTQAKRLYFDVIPKNVDDYLTHISNFQNQDTKNQLTNPVWHIHNRKPPKEDAHLSYNVLLNLAAVCNTEDKNVLWHFISRYRPDATQANAPTLDRLTEYAIEYFRDFVKPSKKYRLPSETEKRALSDLANALSKLPPESTAEEIQTQIYQIGKLHRYENLRDWFKALYEILLGQTTGPRMGSFIALYGLEETKSLILRVQNGEDLGSS